MRALPLLVLLVIACTGDATNVVGLVRIHSTRTPSYGVTDGVRCYRWDFVLHFSFSSVLQSCVAFHISRRLPWSAPGCVRRRLRVVWQLPLQVNIRIFFFV